MSDDFAIRIANLGKRYNLGETVDFSRDLRETVMRVPRYVAAKLRRRKGADADSAGEEAERSGALWALKDINLTIKRGEVIGFVGRNGAGKSTLLKVISRITTPTTGEIEIRGRVGCLLEVGTGMHPELTGRENVFLNGAILGMRKAEISRRFDEIVAFAEVERFLDTPVKRYSSGMRVRLAFAVAAHLDPEILIVDEVLSVGDAEFRRKCLGKMEGVAGGGRTVLFVSHNMQAVNTLCHSVVLLENGQIVEQGDPSTIVKSYLSNVQRPVSSAEITPEMHSTYPPGLEVFRVELFNADGVSTNKVLAGEPLTVDLRYRAHKASRTYTVILVVRTHDGIRLTSVSTKDCIDVVPAEEGQEYRITVRLENIFAVGEYVLDVKIRGSSVPNDLIQGIPFSVESTGGPGTRSPGLVQIKAEWDVGAEASAPSASSES